MRLKISNKLRTISLRSKFICSCIKKNALENNHHSTNTKQHIASSLKTHVRTFYGVFITLAGKAEIEIFVLVSASFSRQSGCMIWVQPAPWSPEVESSRTFFASRTHFEVLGLGLKASNPRKWPCPWLENSTIFWVVKSLWSAKKFFWKTVFSGDRQKKNFEDLFFGEHLRLCSWSLASSIPVLGLRGSVLGRAVVGLGLGFFCVLGLGLEPCVLDSTSAGHVVSSWNRTVTAMIIPAWWLQTSGKFNGQEFQWICTNT